MPALLADFATMDRVKPVSFDPPEGLSQRNAAAAAHAERQGSRRRFQGMGRAPRRRCPQPAPAGVGTPLAHRRRPGIPPRRLSSPSCRDSPLPKKNSTSRTPSGGIPRSPASSAVILPLSSIARSTSIVVPSLSASLSTGPGGVGCRHGSRGTNRHGRFRTQPGRGGGRRACTGAAPPATGAAPPPG